MLVHAGFEERFYRRSSRDPTRAHKLAAARLVTQPNAFVRRHCTAIGPNITQLILSSTFRYFDLTYSSARVSISGRLSSSSSQILSALDGPKLSEAQSVFLAVQAKVWDLLLTHNGGVTWGRLKSSQQSPLLPTGALVAGFNWSCSGLCMLCYVLCFYYCLQNKRKCKVDRGGPIIVDAWLSGCGWHWLKQDVKAHRAVRGHFIPFSAPWGLH